MYFHSQLYHQRSSLEKDAADEILWSKVNVWAMSDAEDDEEGMFYRTLPWRSAEITDIVNRCDSALGIIRRYGAPSERIPNHHCIEFCEPGYNFHEE